MFFRKKEIIVALSSDEIAEKLWGIKKKSVLFQKIGPDQFRVRINSNRPSLFRTAISGTISGKILPAEEKNTNKIVYVSRNYVKALINVLDEKRLKK